MPDKNKVIEGLHYCLGPHECDIDPIKECPYYGTFLCGDTLKLDAITLMNAGDKVNDWLKKIVEAKETYCNKKDILKGLQIAQDIINEEW